MTITVRPDNALEEIIAANTVPAPEAPQPVPHYRPFRQKIRTLFGFSFAIFLALNAFLTFTGVIHFDPYKFNYRGWAWWTMNDLKTMKQTQNVAVLGSSTMVSAFAGCDANYLNKSLDLTKHHNLCYLQDRLRDIFGGNFNAFSLAAPGQMPSDAFLALKAMVNTAHRPDVVIYGIAPRDFVDSTLNGPNDTEQFKFLSRFVNIDDVANAEFRSAWAKLDWLLARTIFMFGYGLDFRMALTDASRDVLDKILPAPHTSKPFTWWDRVRIMPQYLPGEIYPQAVCAGPITEEEARKKYTDNTTEYKQRYKNPDPETYRTQMYFLRKLAEFCNKERIELVLVNMPITLYNASLLKPGLYPQYVLDLEKFSWNHNCTFFDVSDFHRYPQTDFHDSVHLNAFGGKKFFDDMISKMVADHRTATILTMSGMNLETHTELATKRSKHVD